MTKDFADGTLVGVVHTGFILYALGALRLKLYVIYCMCFKSLSLTCGWDTFVLCFPAIATLCSVSQTSHYIPAEQKNLLLLAGFAARPAWPFNLPSSHMELSLTDGPQSRTFKKWTQTLHETTWQTTLITVDARVQSTKYHTCIV